MEVTLTATSDPIGIIASVVRVLQMMSEQGPSGMTRFNDFLMLLSPYPENPYFDTPGEVMTNLAMAALSLILAVICICRMNVLTERHKLVVRLRYLLLFCGAVGTALAPWAFPNNPRLGGLILLHTLVLHLLLSAPEWKHGAPEYTISGWTPLPEEDERNCDDLYCARCLELGVDPNSLWCRLLRCFRMVTHILRGDRRWGIQRGDEDGAP